MTCTSKLQNNIRNGFPILDDPTKVLSFMLRTLLVLKLLKCSTPDGGHLGFVQYGRHRGSLSWLPQEIGRRWLYLPLVQKWCLWNDLNNYLIKPPDYIGPCMMAEIVSRTRSGQGFRVDFFCCGTPTTNTFQVRKLSRYVMGLQGVTHMRTLVRKWEKHKQVLL